MPFFSVDVALVVTISWIVLILSGLWLRVHQRTQLERAKHEFMDLVSHELRTPLGSIRDASLLLSEGDYGQLPENARRVSRDIQRTATRLLLLAETFLSASRLEAGAYRGERVSTDVRHEIQQVMDELSAAAEHKGLALTVDVDQSVPTTCALDQNTLRIVLYNLLDNAIKYTAAGQVSVHCSLKDRVLVIDVGDTGSGFAAEEHALLFKKFWQGSAAQSWDTAGSGLGLFLVKQLLEAAGGTIVARSEGIGTGSIFRFTVPIAS